MVSPMDLLQAGAVYVGIDLCRGNVGVAQHRLDRAEIRAAFQKVSGKGMAQGVRADSLLDPGG